MTASRTSLPSCTGHYVPLLSLAIAEYSRQNADSGFNLLGLAVGERIVPVSPAVAYQCTVLFFQCLRD